MNDATGNSDFFEYAIIQAAPTLRTVATIAGAIIKNVSGSMPSANFEKRAVIKRIDKMVKSFGLTSRFQPLFRFDLFVEGVHRNCKIKRSK